MAIVIPGRRQRLLQDKYAVTRARSSCLAELIHRPTLYTQRFVEKASFSPAGGQRWIRQLQVQIPENAESPDTTWWIVPLGPFARRRFPDIAVIDAAGNRLNLVTRKQHGVALAKVALNKHLAGIPLPEEPNSSDQTKLYESFREYLVAFYTEMGDKDRRKKQRKTLVEEYKTLLTELGQDHKDRLKQFSDDLIDASETTQYLCWAQAMPGEVINLQVEYTTRDPKHKLEDGSLWSLVGSLGTGLLGLGKGLETRRETWNSWYVQYGLAPIPYVFNIPTHEYTASHYSTLEPPDNTYVAYLDWELGNSRDSKDEVDSSFDATHIFNEENRKLKRRPVTHAYLRCAPHHHKQILGVALLNIALVWLLAAERLPSNLHSPLQGVLVAAPSVLIAFLAQQQRHYYAHALRRSRIILWAYLAIEIVFLIGVTFSHAPRAIGSQATAAAWVLAISSAMLFAWQLPLGYGYDRIVNSLTKRKRKMVRLQHARTKWWQKWILYKALALRWSQTTETLWQCYEVAVEQWARWMRRFILIVGLAALVILCWQWPPKKVPPTLVDSPTTQLQRHRAPEPAHPAPTGNHPESRGP